ncbi:MAG TPA: hypothetical protein VLV83_24020 [Acidobacteriota bacterium]|nr:hypothetical protein [Acidobacteriota bacterium]
MSRLVLASPHRYPDLAQLWHLAVRRSLLPALREAGLEVEVVIFCDADFESFRSAGFPGVILLPPGPDRRDFIEFYEHVLRRPCEYLFVLDADVFLLDGAWTASYLQAFSDPEVAAVSFLRRTENPGVYALLCRAHSYRQLSPPVFAASYEGLEDWPDSINHQPGDVAARRLRQEGRLIVDVDPKEAGPRSADFHGTTVIRASRALFGQRIGERKFRRLISQKPYFAIGAYDNLLLGGLYRKLTGRPFAARNGRPWEASVPPEMLAQALTAVGDSATRDYLLDYFQRSDRAFYRLCAFFDVVVELPQVIPEGWQKASREIS